MCGSFCIYIFVGVCAYVCMYMGICTCMCVFVRAGASTEEGSGSSGTKDINLSVCWNYIQVLYKKKKECSWVISVTQQ